LTTQKFAQGLLSDFLLECANGSITSLPFCQNRIFKMIRYARWDHPYL